jgi:hypothetical protein
MLKKRGVLVTYSNDYADNHYHDEMVLKQSYEIVKGWIKIPNTTIIIMEDRDFLS